MTETPLTLKSEVNLEAAIDAMANHLLTIIDDQLAVGKTVLLLLAGGSATKVYARAGQIIRERHQLLQIADDALLNLLIAEGDERWPEKNNTADAIDSGFIETCQKLGAVFQALPERETLEAVATEFESWLAELWNKPNIFTLATVGIGADGHTMSVNVDKNQERFNNLFLSDKLVVGYTSESQTAQFPQFPGRITLSLTALKKVNYILALAAGVDKKPILEKIFAASPIEPNLMPAKVLANYNGTIYTDQNP